MKTTVKLSKIVCMGTMGFIMGTSSMPLGQSIVMTLLVIVYGLLCFHDGLNT